MSDSARNENSPDRANIGQAPFVFPYYFGPAVQPFGSALLWFGHLSCVMLPWISSDPTLSFSLIARRAVERNSPLAPLFLAASNNFLDSCHIVADHSDKLELLAKRIYRIAAIGPGGQARYLDLRTKFPHGISVISQMLSCSEHARIAYSQFIWRCYEYYLELSQNPDAVIDALELEGGPSHPESTLLLECLMNHFRYFQGSTQGIVTDDRNSIRFLATLGKSLCEEEGIELKVPAAHYRQNLSSSIFENVLSGICPPLDGESSKYYLNALETKNDSIESAKRKCFLAADKLKEKRADPDAFHVLLNQAIVEMQKEVMEIIEIDRAAWNKYVGDLLEDRVLWGSCLAFVGGATGALPPVTLAAAAVSILTSVATKGISEIRSKKRSLKESEWAFVYDLSRRT